MKMNNYYVCPCIIENGKREISADFYSDEDLKQSGWLNHLEPDTTIEPEPWLGGYVAYYCQSITDDDMYKTAYGMTAEEAIQNYEAGRYGIEMVYRPITKEFYKKLILSTNQN